MDLNKHIIHYREDFQEYMYSNSIYKMNIYTSSCVYIYTVQHMKDEYEHIGGFIVKLAIDWYLNIYIPTN